MCLIEDQSWIDCIDITSRWDTFVLFHLYGNKGVSLPLWPIRPRWFHTFSACAEPLGDGHEGMGARFGSQGSIALNWHSRYSGTRYSGTWLYIISHHSSTLKLCRLLNFTPKENKNMHNGISIHSQYHCCWCPGDTRSQGISSQGISSHGINLVIPKYSCLSTRRVNHIAFNSFECLNTPHYMTK